MFANFCKLHGINNNAAPLMYTESMLKQFGYYIKELVSILKKRSFSGCAVCTNSFNISNIQFNFSTSEMMLLLVLIFSWQEWQDWCGITTRAISAIPIQSILVASSMGSQFSHLLPTTEMGFDGRNCRNWYTVAENCQCVRKVRSDSFIRSDRVLGP